MAKVIIKAHVIVLTGIVTNLYVDAPLYFCAQVLDAMFR